MTITVRYGAQRQQFGPAEGREVAVLDYSSQQLKLMPMLATCYALHFTAAFLVEQYTQAKRTKEEELVADVHSLSAGQYYPVLQPCMIAHRLSVRVLRRKQGRCMHNRLLHQVVLQTAKLGPFCTRPVHQAEG